VYDKYTDRVATVGLDEESWDLSVRGRTRTFRFASGSDGHLQRRLTMLSQASGSPSTIEKFLLSLLSQWPLHRRLLVDGPEKAKVIWSAEVPDIDTAKAGKSILKLACRASVGGWRPNHLQFVRSLDTKAKATLLAQRGRLKRRERMLDVRTQARVAEILYEAAAADSLVAGELEGLAALALLFQHGVRAVQVLSLRREHVRLLTDASGGLACIVAFHAAKQPAGAEFEIPRQVKPEWSALVERCALHADATGRSRLFSATDAESLWAHVRAGCRRFGLKVTFKANALRHTSAQALADAGHDRESIRRFLGHTNNNSASVCFENSLKQGERVNEALGVSKLYADVLALAAKRFVTVEELTAAAEDKQIGGVVGDRMVAGVGLCASGQSHCRFNPVTSCYGCARFMPSLDRGPHEEAVAGMREQVLAYVDASTGSTSPALRQLTAALSGAQQALAYIERLQGGGAR
jgi:integrase